MSDGQQISYRKDGTRESTEDAKGNKTYYWEDGKTLRARMLSDGRTVFYRKDGTREGEVSPKGEQTLYGADGRTVAYRVDKNGKRIDTKEEVKDVTWMGAAKDVMKEADDGIGELLVRAKNFAERVGRFAERVGERMFPSTQPATLVAEKGKEPTEVRGKKFNTRVDQQQKPPVARKRPVVSRQVKRNEGR